MRRILPSSLSRFWARFFGSWKREWSRVNRAFCRLVHRARYEGLPSEAEQQVALAA